MVKVLLTCFLFVMCLGAQAYENDLDALLGSYVKPVSASGILYNGVDYDAWGKDSRHAKVRDAILAMDVSRLSSKNEKLAFWINAYNVLTIDLITREGETESIKNLGSLLRSPWKKHKWTIDGKSYSLDDIEHETIRPMGEPRIHFAVNCAAKSCPDLRAEAYRAQALDAQLDEQTRLTFRNSSKGYKKESGNTVRVTKVMDWFGVDFDEGNLNSWLADYFPESVNEDTDITFFDYNWSLNKQ